MVAVSLTQNEAHLVLTTVKPITKRDDVTGLLATNIYRKVTAALRKASPRRR